MRNKKVIKTALTFSFLIFHSLFFISIKWSRRLSGRVSKSFSKTLFLRNTTKERVKSKVEILLWCFYIRLFYRKTSASKLSIYALSQGRIGGKTVKLIIGQHYGVLHGVWYSIKHSVWMNGCGTKKNIVVAHSPLLLAVYFLSSLTALRFCEATMDH